MKPDGSDKQFLVQTHVNMMDVSSEGQRIAFVVSSDNYDSLYTCNLDGSDVTEIMRQGAIRDVQWSPDGRYLAVMLNTKRFDDYTGYTVDVVRINQDGSDWMNLTPTEDYPESFIWAMDSQSILFNTQSGTISTIWQMEMTAVKPEIMLDNVENFQGLSQTIDGEKALMLEKGNEGYLNNLKVLDLADGSVEMIELENMSYDENQIVLSPDGSKVSFCWEREHLISDLLYLANLPEQELEVLSEEVFDYSHYDIDFFSNEEEEKIINADFNPVWSPDGEWVLFSGARYSREMVRIINVNRPDWEMWISIDSCNFDYAFWIP